MAGRHGLRRLGPALAGLAVLAFAALAAVPAQAQLGDDTALVSNLIHGTDVSVRGYLAQSFRTGSRGATGYVIGAVWLQLGLLQGGGAAISSVVTIRNNNSDDEPGELVATLSVAGSPALGNVNEFLVPDGTVLATNTTYWVTAQVETGSEDEPVAPLILTNSNAEYSFGGDWSIGNDSLERDEDTDDWETNSNSLRMLIRGQRFLSSDATLSALSLTAGGNPVQFLPGFSSDRFSYRVDAGTAATVTVTVSATKNEDGADVRLDTVNIDTDDIHFLGNDYPFTSTEGPTATLTLRPDKNAVRVRVTAANRNVRTYTVAYVFPDTTLSALDLTLRPDEGGTAVALVPPFSSETTSYSATVASPDSRLRLTMATGHIAGNVIVGGDEYAHDHSVAGRRISEVNLREGFNSIDLIVKVNGAAETTRYRLRVLRRGPPPRLVRATVAPRGANGTVDTVYLQYDRGLRPDGPDDRGNPWGPPASAFSVTVNGSPVAVTGTDIVAEYVDLRLARALGPGERQVAVSYTPPATNPVQTSIGGLALALTDLPVEITIPLFRPGTGGRSGRELLRASMTVGYDSGERWAGYSDGEVGDAIGSLTGTGFRFDGVDFTISTLFVDEDGELSLALIGSLTQTAAARLDLYVGGRRFRFAEAPTYIAAFTTVIGGYDFGMDLPVGARVPVRIADVNRLPVFREGGASRRYLLENPGSVAGGSGAVTTIFSVAANDFDGDRLRYELTGRDAHLFTIDEDTSWIPDEGGGGLRLRDRGQNLHGVFRRRDLFDLRPLLRIGGEGQGRPRRERDAPPHRPSGQRHRRRDREPAGRGARGHR